MGLGNPAKAETPERLLDITILAPSFMGPPLRFLDRGHWNEMVMLCERHFYFFLFFPNLRCHLMCQMVVNPSYSRELEFRVTDPSI